MKNLANLHSNNWPQKNQIQIKFEFVELLGRSNFSFLQGASHPEELIEEAIRLDYAGLGLCDLNGLYGIGRGFQAFKAPSLFTASLNNRTDFRYLVGAELTLTDASHVALLPMSKKGYTHLCRLITLGKRQAKKGFSQLTPQQVFEHNEDLLCFLIPPTPLERFEQYQNVFNDRLYLPVWKDYTWESLQFYQQALDLEFHGAQLFVTNRPVMHHTERKRLFDVMTCLHHQCTLQHLESIRLTNSERHLVSKEELFRKWQERPDLLSQTLTIAQRVNFSLEEIRYRYPKTHLPKNLSPAQYLQQLTLEGLKWRFPEEVPTKALNMALYELKIIQELEYEDYFLTLFEICNFAKSKNILFQGRGSAANSVVCFALGLTNVNPMQIDLLFERFISTERGEPPDIDIDFEHERREEVIQHIYEKYNPRHAAMVCTVIRYRSRMAFRDVAKVFDLPLNLVNQIIKFMGRDGLKRLVADDPSQPKKWGLSGGQWQALLELTHQLHGFPRHLGIHTGGFIITQDPIEDLVPVEKASMQGRYVIQWNKDDVNFLKMMKLDLLSLGMLTALRKSLDLLKQHKNLNYNLATLPTEDKATYEMICKAKTIGVFQIESRAQMQTLPRMRPKTFYDLVIEVALVRPGPLQGGMVHPFLKRRQGLEKVTYPHPDLEWVLKKTHGVPIFQEQVMKISIVAAGFSPGEADELRRVMSNAWRKKVTMEGLQKRLFMGFKKFGVSDEDAEKIFKVLEGFASYGFPESHAASFAVLTYASCYLKCHHPDVFTCALLNSQPMGFYPPRVLLDEAKRDGVELLPLCIQASEFDYTLEKSSDSIVKKYLSIRVGLRSLYGFKETELKAIVSERLQNGLFKDFSDLVKRTRLTKKTLHQLAAAGALETFGESPRVLIWKIESLSLDEESLMWGQAKETFADDDAIEIPEESEWQQMTREQKTKGFSIHQHPMGLLRNSLLSKNAVFKKLKQVSYRSSQDVESLKHKTSVRAAGLLSMTQRPPTAKGVCFLTLEDEFGFLNIVVPAEVYQRDRLVIYTYRLLEIQGELEVSGQLRNIKARRLLPLKLIESGLIEPQS